MALAPEADAPKVIGSSGTADNLAPFPQARAVNRHCGRDLGHLWAWVRPVTGRGAGPDPAAGAASPGGLRAWPPVRDNRKHRDGGQPRL